MKIDLSSETYFDATGGEHTVIVASVDGIQKIFGTKDQARLWLWETYPEAMLAEWKTLKGARKE
jgi:hypothetical protein